MGVLDLTTLALNGFNLVEASAGTGKTHTLTGLYLRLLIEQSLSPEQILVVTYTNAASAELQERIRRRLVSAREAYQRGESADPLIQHLLQTQADTARVVRRLNLAIAGFDQAAIHTIHGFCQRVLIENAFETHQPFDAELVPDQTPQLLEIAEDFWRRRITGLPDSVLEHFLASTGTPARLLSEVRQGVGKPYLEVRGASSTMALEPIDAEIGELIRELLILWQQEGADISNYLVAEGQFNQSSYKRVKVPGWCRAMADWLAQEPPLLTGFDHLKKFTESSIKQALRKDRSGVEFEFFSRCEVVESKIAARKEQLDQSVRRLRWEFFDYLLEELPLRQRAAGEWSYDDLLLHLDQALSGRQGERLARRLSQRYPAALVDEFQDTDPLQYRILNSIYNGRGQALFLVGDPKQAIYSFRGADIFAYLAAREAAQGLHTLETNWRSTPQLVTALNTLFSAHPAAFFYPQIEYHPVKAAPPSGKGLREKADRAGPFRIWQLPFQAQAKLSEVRQTVADATANEIIRLLNQSRANRLSIDDRPLAGGDIAVLVRNHRQAERIAAALMEKGVRSVRAVQDNVFLSLEAEQLERLLLAVAEPRREALLRAALSTELLGWDGVEIDRLNRDDDVLSEQFDRFLAYHEAWRDDGFIRMFRRLIDELEVARRLLNFRDGERRLTNLYHLGELLHRQDSTSQPGMEGLLKWFSRQRQDEGTRDEERLLRLESESNLVKVVTQHGSKGLQYPVVFCPFLWDASPRGGRSMKAYLFHDPGAAFRPIFELGSSEFARHRRFLREEELAEDVRLLYVALTRARYRCYLPWGKTKNSEHSALAWLLHPADTHEGQSLDDWQAAFQQLTPADMTHRLEYLVARSGGQISLEPLPKAVAAGQLSLELPPDLLPARNFSGVIRETGWVSSFSSLTAGQTLELADHDAVSLAADERRMEAPGTIHGFPRGAQPGSCLHAIFEELDFCSECAGQVARLVEAKLAAYAIEPHWQTVVSKMLSAVLNTPLNDAGLLLRDIPSNQRINEMEFLYPVHQLDCRRLSALAREHGFARSGEFASVIGQLDFRRAEGFMKGFIDLIIEADGCYYLLDYKSNWLGEDRSWYTQPHLHAAMLAHHYPLQYLFYVLALHRYLKYRLSDYDYDVHFGGVFYLFLRGMSPDTGPHCGVFYERPPASFILALDQWLTEADA